MNTPMLASLLESYQWQLSLYTAIGIAAVTIVGKQLLLLVPTIRETRRLNQAALATKMEKPNYAANQKWNRKWGLFYWAVIFVLMARLLLRRAQLWVAERDRTRHWNDEPQRRFESLSLRPVARRTAIQRRLYRVVQLYVFQVPRTRFVPERSGYRI